MNHISATLLCIAGRLMMAHLRYWPRPCPTAPGRLAISFYFLAWAKKLRDSRVRPDLVHSAIELARLTVQCEDFGIQQEHDASLSKISLVQLEPMTTHTVIRSPVMMTPRLKVCCAVLAAFSRLLRSPQRILPSSFATVICFLEGPAESPTLCCKE